MPRWTFVELEEVINNFLFSFKVTKRGEVLIFHHGMVATTLRGTKAQSFLAETERSDDDAQQQLMARLTGNYKRGNERKAKNHPRNRQ